MKKTLKWMVVASVAFVAALAGCGGGGDDSNSGGGFIPTKATIAVATVPMVLNGQKVVTVLMSFYTESYGTTQSVIVKNDTTGAVLLNNPPGWGSTPGPIISDTKGYPVVLPVGETVVSVYVNGATVPTTTTTFVVSCVSGTAPDNAGVCN